jgi:hypothetical protein
MQLKIINTFIKMNKCVLYFLFTLNGFEFLYKNKTKK